MNIVINASPIIFLAKVGIVQVMPNMFDSFVIPEGVKSEVLRGRDEAADWISEQANKYIKAVGPIPDLIMLSIYQRTLQNNKLLMPNDSSFSKMRNLGED